jgi:hypothetical protein
MAVAALAKCTEARTQSVKSFTAVLQICVRLVGEAELRVRPNCGSIIQISEPDVSLGHVGDVNHRR